VVKTARYLLVPLILGTLAWSQFGIPGQGGLPPAPPGGGYAAPPQGGALPQLPQPGLPMATGKRYPLPAWIRPGVGFVYQDPTGQITLLMLVTDTDGTNAYGLFLNLIQTQGGPMLMVKPQALVQNGQGLFYLNPQAVADALAAARAEPDPNLRVFGGNGSFAYEYQSPNGRVAFAARYDPKTGIITELNSLMASAGAPGQPQPHREGIQYHYRGYETFTWQSPTDFPSAAREAHTYQLISQMPDYLYGGSMATPIGNMEIRPLHVARPLARYQIRANQGGIPITQPAFGLTALGPHYLHPALLGRGTVLQSRYTGLSLTFTQEGLVWTVGQLPLSRTRIDPQTGLLLEETDQTPLGAQVIMRLVH